MIKYGAVGEVATWQEFWRTTARLVLDGWDNLSSSSRFIESGGPAASVKADLARTARSKRGSARCRITRKQDFTATFDTRVLTGVTSAPRPYS